MAEDKAAIQFIQTGLVSGNLLLFQQTLIIAVGNKILFYNLKERTRQTLSFNSSHNYKTLALSPNGRLLVAVNEIGLTHCISLVTNSLLHCMKLSDGSVLKFSPNGSYLAVGEPKMVKVYRAPSDSSGGVAPLGLERVFPNVPGNVTSLDWSWDSVLLVAASSESPMISVFSMLKFSNFRNPCFTGHKLGIVGVFFEAMEYNLITVCKGGNIARWICSYEPEEWERDTESSRLNQDKTDWISKDDDESASAHTSKKIKVDKDAVDSKKQLICFNLVPVDWCQREQQKDTSKRLGNLKLKCVDLNQRRTLAVLGFESGGSYLVGLPRSELVLKINTMQHDLAALTFSPEGDWIAGYCQQKGYVILLDLTNKFVA